MSKNMTIIKANGVRPGVVEGEILISRKPFGFFLGIDPETGVIVDKNSDVYGESIKDKIFLFPFGRGSTGAPGFFIQSIWFKTNPKAIVNIESEPMIIVCSLIAEEFFNISIPIIDGISRDEFFKIPNRGVVHMNGESGELKIF